MGLFQFFDWYPFFVYFSHPGMPSSLVVLVSFFGRLLAYCGVIRLDLMEHLNGQFKLLFGTRVCSSSSGNGFSAAAWYVRGQIHSPMASRPTSSQDL
ncbi:hypothetical protein ACH5RR_039199 [Cinchona calisaya]|uniref:Uncharacterized protein n=1 Tax=Cinchona calisaya TaxID=153742 RepID=A0ABD2XXI8_9GENT